MNNEVKMYQILNDLQGKYIPKLECYGYFEYGMCYVIGTTLVGITLRLRKYIAQSWRLFDEEKRKLKSLLDHYTLLDSHSI
ncbi:14923_t:CDS:2 [Funneliformis mosseae]|uniref:14923_t:CDS:1 n=1 Tax=Funneliformis mosseae TaxID=27381 RepID=A0A9N8VIJ7_FUNMO|nr:14923_t:CDS:2 [Funneliformis mosseae]